GGVDGGQVGAGHDDRVEAGNAQRVTDAEVLAGNDGDIAGGEVVVPGGVDDHGVVGRRVKALQADATVGLGHAGTADKAVRGADGDGGAGKRCAVGTGDGDAKTAGLGRQGCADEAHAQCDRERAPLQAFYKVIRSHFCITP